MQNPNSHLKRTTFRSKVLPHQPAEHHSSSPSIICYSPQLCLLISVYITYTWIQKINRQSFMTCLLAHIFLYPEVRERGIKLLERLTGTDRLTNFLRLLHWEHNLYQPPGLQPLENRLLTADITLAKPNGNAFEMFSAALPCDFPGIIIYSDTFRYHYLSTCLLSLDSALLSVTRWITPTSLAEEYSQILL